MKTKDFISQLEKDRIIAAIREAERGNSGDVVLFITHKPVEDAVVAAHALFQKLKLEQTNPQNSVLIFLAPKSQKLAVVGGTDLDAQLPENWWTEVVVGLTRSFAEAQITKGMETALHCIGEAQRKYFPTDSFGNRAGQQDLLEDS